MTKKFDYKDLSPFAQSAVRLGKEILAKVEDLPERAEDYAESVATKTTGILDWVESNNHVTKAQMDALRNMCSGVEKWLK